MGYRIAPPPRQKGNNAQSIRYIGLLILALGIIGQCILQNRILGVNVVGSDEALKAVLDQADNMKYATIAIVAMAVQTCAIPIFAFLLVEGVKHTKNYRNYFLRVLGVAVVSEIPYDLATTAKVFDFSTQNPALTLALALIMIYILKQYGAKTVKGIAISALVIAMGLIWVGMLRVSDGIATMVMIITLWYTRRKLGYQVFGGCVVMFLCMTLSPLYFAAPLMFLLLHFYNGEPGEGNRWINYLAYPVLLLGTWIVSIVAF